MEKEKLEKMLKGLGESTVEAVRPELAEQIKRQIPDNLSRHRGGMHTVSIIIDLRISKLAAAIAIVATMILLANFLGGRDSSGGGLYHESKLLLKYFLGTGKDDASRIRSRYEYLVGEGKEVFYYGDSINAEDGNAVLLHWKISEGRYKVVFGDLRESEVSAEELIRLQARMLQKKPKTGR